MKILHAYIDSNIHFMPSGLFLGALGAENGFWVSPGVSCIVRALATQCSTEVLADLKTQIMKVVQKNSESENNEKGKL